jgi:oligoendopeptidase F
MSTRRVPNRNEVAVEDTWDLSRLFADDAAWEAAFIEYEKVAEGYAQYRGKLDSPATLLQCLHYDTAADRLGDRIGNYAFLKESEDVAESKYQGMKARYVGVASRVAEAASYIRPELLALPAESLNRLVNAELLIDYKLVLERLLRYKPHTLTDREERLLAMQGEIAQTPRQVFDQLNDADLKFGEIEVAPGEKLELSHGTFLFCLENPDRSVRETAFRQYYAQFQSHANTFAASLAGSIRQDVYYARARNYSGARAAALFPDNVPESVYDNLVAAVRANLPAVHKYYAVRKRALKLPDIHHYDVYLPIVQDFKKETPWKDAVELIIESLKPLGDRYTDALAAGLRGRWCDRYENRGKHSGAFSAGCYDSDPYILMNYRPDVLDHVFTLAHEAGHSLHTHFSKNQPYQYSNYTIFVAEVASTFNEQLLGEYLLKRAQSPRERAYYLNREIDDVRRTIVRQTMFAEFEQITHRLAENNEPLTLESLRSEYRKLLDAYFGPDFIIDDELSLECLRIPHFYRAFYVYKYATGLSAAMALSERVLHGGATELNDYLRFLHGGSSQDPLDLLRGAGVDMETPGPVDAALAKFSRLVDELDTLV